MLPVLIGVAAAIGVSVVLGNARKENNNARDNYRRDFRNAKKSIQSHYETQKEREERERKAKAKKLQQKRNHILKQELYARKKEYKEVQQNLKKHKVLLSELFEQKHKSKYKEEKREIQKHINQVLEVRKILFASQDKLKNTLNNAYEKIS